MALEPITRQEQIIAGKDLKPITRMEKFLKEYGGSGGSGGGATSWEDLGSTFEKKLILEETTVTIDPESGEGGTPDVISLTIGNEYTVNWNGVHYQCMAQDASALIPGAAALGDFGMIENEEPTEGGEPFVIMAIPADMVEEMGGVGVVLIALDGSESVMLSITGMMETVTPIPEKYIGSIILYVGSNEFVYKTKDTSNRENALTVSELKSIVNSGKAIYLHDINDEGGETYTAVCNIIFGEIAPGVGGGAGYLRISNGVTPLYAALYVANSPSDIP